MGHDRRRGGAVGGVAGVQGQQGALLPTRLAAEHRRQGEQQRQMERAAQQQGHAAGPHQDLLVEGMAAAGVGATTGAETASTGAGDLAVV